MPIFYKSLFSIGIYVILQSYCFKTSHFLSDVKPYYCQVIRSALDHKEGNEFGIVFS